MSMSLSVSGALNRTHSVLELVVVGGSGGGAETSRESPRRASAGRTQRAAWRGGAESGEMLAREGHRVRRTAQEQLLQEVGDECRQLRVPPHVQRVVRLQFVLCTRTSTIKRFVNCLQLSSLKRVMSGA